MESLEELLRSLSSELSQQTKAAATAADAY